MYPALRDASAHQVSPAIRVAAVLYLALGIGFGVGAAITLDHLRREHELPMTPFGFRSLAGGPFEQLTPDQFTALGWGLVGVCALDVASAALLWRRRRDGAVLGLATTPAALLMAAGFALPFLLVGVPIRVALVLAGRRSLR
jgi:hypothetical protein